MVHLSLLGAFMLIGGFLPKSPARSAAGDVSRVLGWCEAAPAC